MHYTLIMEALIILSTKLVSILLLSGLDMTNMTYHRHFIFMKKNLTFHLVYRFS